MTTNRHPQPPDDDSGPFEPMPWAEFQSCISDYVARRLRDPVQTRFEDTLLAYPDWVEWVTAERLLQDGARDLAKTEQELFDPERRKA